MVRTDAGCEGHLSGIFCTPGHVAVLLIWKDNLLPFILHTHRAKMPYGLGDGDTGCACYKEA